MTSLAIADVPWISKRIKACCRRAKLFSTDEILLSQPQQLQQALRISQADVDLLVLQVATASAPPPLSVLDALNGVSPPTLDDDLFENNCNDGDSAEDSQDSDADDRTNDTRLPPSSIVPPTQGYDGNFPGADRYVYDSDSDSGSNADARYDVMMMHDDVEPPSTFRPRLAENDDKAQYQDESLDNDPNAIAQPTVARDVLSLGRDRHVLTSGAKELDDLFGGGYRSAALTEIVGESGSGKTQMAIQACTYAALGFVPLPAADEQNSSSIPSLDRGVSDNDTLRDILKGYGMAQWTDSTISHNGLGACYITSSGERGAHSIVNRALELAESAIGERFDRISSSATEPESSQDSLNRHILLARALELGREQVLRNLHVACVADVEALEHALKYSLPGLISRLSKQSSRNRNVASSQIGMIVVDNLPSLFQEDPVAGDIDSLVQRSKMLVEIVDALKRLASPSTSRLSPNMAISSDRVVLVVNHVSDAFGQDKDIARRFVFDSADRIRLARAQTSTQSIPENAYPDYPVAMEYATQSAFVSGLLASVPPTLAEAIGSQADRGTDNDGPLYVLSPRTAQLGHTWTNLINVRIFLSKTRGRVAMPTPYPTSMHAVAEDSGDDAERATKSVMTTVRKAAVVINPFGPTMLDPPDSTNTILTSSTTNKTGNRHLRYVITPSRAIHPLNPYNLTTTTTSINTTITNDTLAAGSANQALSPASQTVEEEEEDEEFYRDLNTSEEQHFLLAIEQFLEVTPLS